VVTRIPQPDSTISSLQTRTQHSARDLYGLGFNVFPQPYGKKAGLPWKQLQYTRLHPDDLNSLFAGQCNLAVMCGHTSGNLFVIDCESILALNTHIGHLRQRGIPLWIVQTARGGHLYLRCADGEVASIESGILPDAEIRGAHGYVLAPDSVHPTGALYQWYTREGAAPPTIHAANIDWLKDSSGHPIKLKLTKGKKRSFTPYNPLSRATQDYLNSGHTLPEGSRNNRLFSAACDLLGNHYPPHTIERQLAPIATSSGLPQHEAYATLHSAFSRPRLPARPQHLSTPKPQTEIWQHARTFAETHPWQGRSSTTDKLAFLALSERARTANENGVFRASLREISVLARTSLNPIKKALKRFKEAHFIFYAGRDKTSNASLWRFSSFVLQQGKEKSDSSPPAPPWISWSESLFHSTDAAERGALGYTGLSVYQTLRDAGQPLLPSALAAQMNFPPHRVNYALRKLRDYALVQREKAGWRAVAVSDAELDERVARPAGKLGRGAARREKYAAERAKYVGQIILRARLDLFREEFLAQPRELPPESAAPASTLMIWRCPNCGQQHFAAVPPDTCDFCRDFTTWARFEPEGGADSDPLVQEALLLGAEIYTFEGGQRRRLYPLLE